MRLASKRSGALPRMITTSSHDCNAAPAGKDAAVATPDRECAEETEASLAGCSCWPEAEGESSFTGSDPDVWLAHRHCTYKQDGPAGPFFAAPGSCPGCTTDYSASCSSTSGRSTSSMNAMGALSPWRKPILSTRV